MAHGHDDNPRHAAIMAATAIAAAFSLNDHRAEIYYDIIIASLSDAAQEALAMIPENYQFQDEGLRRAWAHGEVIGVSKGLADALLDTLEARSLLATAADISQIRSCVDPDVLRRWHRRALTAVTVTDIFQ